MSNNFIVMLSVFATINLFLWVTTFPSSLWKSLTFRNNDGFFGHLISVVTFFFV